MPVRPCDFSTTCPPDAPLDNFSSEADDTIDYISTRFAQNPPPLLHNFDATACGETFVSQISQLDADLQAAANALQCVYSHLDPTPTLFTNSPQTCCVPCPDGTNTCYQVPGGLFPGVNQASADAAAHAVACDLVNRNKICLGSIPGCTCVGTPYGAVITSTVPATFSIAGSLPPGVTFSTTSNTVVLIGNPVVMGQYTFQITAQTAQGPYMIKTFTITVLQIVTTSLPPFTIGTPYSFQLLVAGGSGNYAWKLTSGTLPTGITLSLTGLLSGTPTSSGVNPLQFSVIDTTCESIDQTFFPPSIALATKSTTQIATVIGFPEYGGFVSTPPKRYHTLTWTGSSEQQLWQVRTSYQYLTTDLTGTTQWLVDGACWATGGNAICFDGAFGVWRISFVGSAGYTRPASPGGPAGVYTKDFGPGTFPATVTVSGPFTTPGTPLQVAGARFDYSGSSSIDSKGNYTSLYSKILSEMCTKADNLCSGIGGSSAGGYTANYKVPGWIGPNGFTLCTPPGTPYTSIGDEAVKKGDAATADAGFGSGINFDANGNFLSFNPTFQATSATTGQDIQTNQQNGLGALFTPLACGTAVTLAQGFTSFLKWIQNYTSTLSTEYTDAEALANAQVIQGTGAVAQNQPRTTGFVSVFTNVVYTITLGNLISGVSYTVSVDLADITAGTVTTKIYNVSGSAASTTITDIIPTPAVGHLVQVRNARIAFS